MARPDKPPANSSIKPSSRRCSASMVASLALLVLAGCGEDEIRHYKAARLAPAKAAATSRAPVRELRLLAAIIPHGDRTWFFKLVGPPPAIDTLTQPFEQFIRSIRFEEGTEISWMLPDGWEQQPGSASRYATIHIDSDDNHLDLTVVPLGREAGTLLDNVNRWRRNDLGLGPVTESDLGPITRNVQMDAISAVLVDMTNADGTLPPGHPPIAATAGQPPRPRAPLNYTIPEGWIEATSESAFRVASFEVKRDGQRADVSITPLSGAAGGLLANVNRWRREQLRLPEFDQAQLREALQRIDVAGSDAPYVHLVGPESAGEHRQAILAVILERDGQTWFFKMIGPLDLVAQQKSAFEAFVRSIRFE